MIDNQNELWHVLGLNPGDQKSLSRGWNYFAKKFHPDMGGDHDRYVLAKKAYDKLSKPDKKLKKIIRLTLEQLHAGKTITLTYGDHTLEVEIPRGGPEGNVLKTRVDNIDIEFVLEILPHCNFELKHNYLFSRQPVNALDLVLDKKIYFQTLFGEPVQCYNTALRNNNLAVFTQKGMWYQNRMLDLVVEPLFVFPELNASKRMEIERCLKS